ncbi:MAG: glycosyltransferase family 9 protein [Candidatus Omnitrophica bacterium]|nr:glycosyltransferase family 9 protein [Candidatus Omnitrophota bacterium]
MRILIVKLGALGDVLRTTPLLAALKGKYPGCHITWLVDKNCREVLTGNPLISRLLSSPEERHLLEDAAFDLAINLDKEEEALEAIAQARAVKKMGFGRSPDGTLCALDALSDYAYRLGIDDELKFKQNKKTYQEISFEQAGLSFKGEEYLFPLGDEDSAYAQGVLEELGLGSLKGAPLVGLNTGSGKRFAGKKLPVETCLELIERFYKEMKAAVLLLGGEEERERNQEIQKKSRCPVWDAGSHPIRRFAAIVRRCGLVVSGDTTAMHVAIAMEVPVVAYFASTCAAEIELYGRGRKIVSGISCAPCYKKACPVDEQCMKEMRADALFEAAKEVLADAGTRCVSRSGWSD